MERNNNQDNTRKNTKKLTLKLTDRYQKKQEKHTTKRSWLNAVWMLILCAVMQIQFPHVHTQIKRDAP